MQKNLKNLIILITRPEHQAAPLINLVRRLQGTAILFPTVCIKPLSKTAFSKKIIENLTLYDIILFTSPNAVVYSEKQLRHYVPEWFQPSLRKKKPSILAIGAGTAAILKKNKLTVDDVPKKIFSSEALLNLDLLKAPQQKKILIIKGQAGNLTLIKELTKRKAEVSLLNVYKRLLPSQAPDISHIKKIDIILCTSITGLQNSIVMLYPIWKEKLFEQQLLVISPRIADYAVKRGFVKPPLIADNATHKAILKALLAWWGKS